MWGNYLRERKYLAEKNKRERLNSRLEREKVFLDADKCARINNFFAHGKLKYSSVKERDEAYDRAMFTELDYERKVRLG